MSDKFVVKDNVRFNRERKSYIAAMVISAVVIPATIARMALGVLEHESMLNRKLQLYLYNCVCLAVCLRFLASAISAARNVWINYSRPVFGAETPEPAAANDSDSGSDEEKAVESATVTAVHVE